MARRATSTRWLGAMAALLLLLLLLLATATAPAAAARKRGHVAASSDADGEAKLVSMGQHALATSAMRTIGRLRARARARSAGAEAEEGALLQAAASASASASGSGVTRRGAGGKAGRAGGKAGVAAGNAGQSGRKAGDAAGNGGQSGRKAGDAAGNGGQSGRKAGDAAGNGGQSGRKAGDASGNGGQSGRKAGDASGDAGQSGRKAGDASSDAGQSGRKAGDLPVSPIIGSAPPDASNVMTLVGVKRNWPVNIYLRNQGDAATCWAQSAVSLLELRQQMGFGKNLLSTWYSVDQVVKCVPNDGAGGGSPLDAIQFLINSKLMTDADVRAGKAITCDSFDWEKTNGNTGRYSLQLVHKPCINPGENCSRMRDYEYLLDYQFMLTPMLVYVDASQWDSYAPKFNAADVASYALGTAADYSAVAFPTSKCSMDPAKGDHIAILLGTVKCPKTGKKYWRVYNSWGKEWGVNGYIYLEYEVNACGLGNYPIGLIQSGGSSKPMFMLPKTVSHAATAVSDDSIGIVGGSELFQDLQRP